MLLLDLLSRLEGDYKAAAHQTENIVKSTLPPLIVTLCRVIVRHAKLYWNTEQRVKIRKWLRKVLNYGLILLSAYYSVWKNKIPSKDRSSNVVILVSMIGAIDSVPTWLVTCSVVKKLSLLIVRLRKTCSFLKLFNNNNKAYKLRQFVFTFIVIMMNGKDIKPAILQKFLFKRKDLWFLTNFISIYLLFGSLSIIEILKSNIYYKRQLKRNNGKYTKGKSSINPTLASSNCKPLVDKLSEIYEISNNKQSHGMAIFERLLNSFLSKNIIISLKWTIWLQSLYYVTCKYPNSKCIQFFLISLSMRLIDGNVKVTNNNNNNNNNKRMNVNSRTLKTLLQILTSYYIDKHSDVNIKKIILFINNLM